MTVLSFAAQYVYITDDKHNPIKSSLYAVSKLMMGEIEEFTPHSDDYYLDTLVYFGYTFTIVCIFSEFVIAFILQAGKENKVIPAGS